MARGLDPAVRAPELGSPFDGGLVPAARPALIRKPRLVPVSRLAFLALWAAWLLAAGTVGAQRASVPRPEAGHESLPPPAAVPPNGAPPRGGPDAESLPQPGKDERADRAATPSRVLRHRVFQIPFTVQANDGHPMAVELYVSTDAGASWKLYGRQPPAASHFPFRAEEDGEFWFASRTIDADLAPPSLQLRPQLHVAIDTQEPALEFHAELGPAQEIVTSWHASDRYLAADSFKVEYQQRAGGPWLPIAVDRRQVSGSDEKSVGRFTWWPRGTTSAVHIRAEVSDRAGNKAAVNRVVYLPAGSSGNEDRLVSTSPRSAAVPDDPYADAASQPFGPVTWPADNRLPSPAPNARAPRAPPPRPPGTHRPPGTWSPGSTAAAPPSTRAPAAASSSASPPAGQFVAHRTDRKSVEPPWPELPSGAEPRMTRSMRFELDYEVPALGPESIRKVELWGTSDGGRTWSVWKLDEDRVSPVRVEVEQEGIFGFRIVVVAQNGLAGTAPRNGDPADFWIGVDATPPSVRLQSATFGQGDRAGQLAIRWQAADRRLAEQPVTVLFSEQAGGPWTTVATGLENHGHYDWKIDRDMPEEVYLRIEARDAAGNRGADQLSDPIRLSGLSPKARIRGLRPSTSSTQRLPAVRR